MALTIQLPLAIRSREEAIAYLKMLHETDYAYHCDDSVYDGTPEGNIIWSDIPESQRPTVSEQIHLDLLMNQVHKYHNDPCAVLCSLSGMGMDVQGLIDLLMLVEDKSVPIMIYNTSDGSRGEISLIDDTIEGVIELNVNFND